MTYFEQVSIPLSYAVNVIDNLFSDKGEVSAAERMLVAYLITGHDYADNSLLYAQIKGYENEIECLDAINRGHAETQCLRELLNPENNQIPSG